MNRVEMEDEVRHEVLDNPAIQVSDSDESGQHDDFNESGNDNEDDGSANEIKPDPDMRDNDDDDDNENFYLYQLQQAYVGNIVSTRLTNKQTEIVNKYKVQNEDGEYDEYNEEYVKIYTERYSEFLQD